MKKRLLLSLLAVCTAVTGFALEVNEYVYTPQGRFKILDNPVKTVNFDEELTGWTGVSATEGKAAKDIFAWNANGCADGIHSVKSTDATEGEGMYMKFEPNGQTYVVSFKMKGDVAVSVRSITTEVSTNLVKVEGNSDGTFGGTTDAYVCSKGEELTADWQTFNYAISGEATSLVYFISFSGMATNIEIADLQIAPAVQVADLRQRDAMIEKMEAYKNVYAWKDEALEDLEVLGALKEIGDESRQNELDEILLDCQDALNTFINANMDDYLAGNSANYFGIKETSGNAQKQEKIGDWTAFPEKRGFWSNGAYPDFGHFQQGGKWCNGSPDAPMGVSLQKELTAGSYVFAIEGNAAVREPKKQCWTNDEGMKPAYGVAYIVKVVDGANPDTIVSVVKELQPIQYTPFVLPAKITEDGTYEFGFKAYCKDTHKNLTMGSVVYLKDASIWGKNENVYNQKQLGYEADVREQITTGRTQLETAKEYIASADYFWGKDSLQACIDTIEVKIATYELLDQDAIIATYNQYIEDNGEDSYKKATNDPAGILVYEVYQEAVKYIIAANKEFLRVNGILESLQEAIDAAEATMALRIYDTATRKGDLQGAIEDAKGCLASMKKLDYDETNEFLVEGTVLALNEEVEAFKASIPNENIATIVDIDFENDATQDAETQLYSIAGAAGVMEFSHFSTLNPEGEDSPYQQGFWDNAEQKWKGYLRVGNGTGTVEFDPTIEGEMGTNILKVSCDFYIQGLSNRSIGFYLKDAGSANISGIVHNYYNGTVTYNPFVDGDAEKDALMGKVWAKSGGSYNDASPADADDPTATVIEKTHFEIIMDYGRQSMYCNISSSNGSATSKEVALAGIPVKFELNCNYDNKFATRRCWFDNLKIERITAGETEQFVDGIEEIANPETEVKAPVKYFKNGRIVINGKYGINGVLIK